MRHTLATNLVDAGVAVEDVSKILRHKDSTTTARVYVHEIRSADALRRRADLLEKMASGMESPNRDTAAPTPGDGRADVAYLSQTGHAVGASGTSAR